MDRKVALLSLKGYNYGTCLQRYALLRKVRELGCEVEYISYCPRDKSLKNSFVGKPLRKLSSLFMRKEKGIDDFSFFSTEAFAEIAKRYDSFDNEYVPCRMFKDCSELSNTYDKFIVGSDQVWSQYFISRNNSFTLEYIKDDDKKYSYASSLGTTQVSETHMNEVLRAASHFRRVSCREQANCKTLSQRLGKEVFCAVDPTMLLTGDEWRALSSSVEGMPKRYILCYILVLK